MLKLQDYHLQDPTWCHGCGLYGLFSALKKAAFSLKINPEKMSIISGIGCHGRLNNYFNAYGFHSLHGRALPIAQGVKLANTRLSVVAVSGDGDAYSIGLGHFIHSLRRNVDMTYIVVNNRIYGLTQGQTSPTSREKFVSPRNFRWKGLKWHSLREGHLLPEDFQEPHNSWPRLSPPA